MICCDRLKSRGGKDSRLLNAIPYCAHYHRRLAVRHAEAGRWAESARAVRAALGLDISLVEARIALVVSQARLGDLSRPAKSI
jgi:hypothetical protein